jgi:ubiquinone/menaquinone biosynthesis C-methylase UbiE
MAKYYDKVRPTPANTLLNNIIKYGGINNSSYVLDIGCGTGRYPINMPVNPYLFCALEPSIDMLKQAVEKDKPKRRAWVRGDGQNLPFRGNMFTCTYMTLVLHHIEDKPKTLKEIHRTLRSNGNLVVMTISHQQYQKRHTQPLPRRDVHRPKARPRARQICKPVSCNGFETRRQRWNSKK